MLKQLHRFDETSWIAFIIVGSTVAGMYLTLLFIYSILFANMIPYLFRSFLLFLILILISFSAFS